MGPRGGLDAAVREKFSAPTGIRTPEARIFPSQLNIYRFFLHVFGRRF
jgi:hypothetical protein